MLLGPSAGVPTRERGLSTAALVLGRSVWLAARPGVPEGPLLGRLAKGEHVIVADGRRVEPDQVLGPERPGRTAVLCGDSADSGVLAGVAADCDLLVHECTFAPEEQDKARRTGHSSAADVIDLARRVRPRLLVLSHWIPRYASGRGTRSVEELRREIADALPGMQVVAGSNLLELEIPERER